MDNRKLAGQMVTSKKHEELLDVIDALRRKGVSHFVDLPQLIVCGDQSSGKSSVLEALSGLNFPRKETLCTRFATEVILRRGPDPKVDVSIIPDKGKTEEELEALEKFGKKNIAVDQIAEVIKSSEEGMGINSSSKHFSKDVLRVEVTGPKHPNLTLAVEQLVLGYMQSKRSIILAVISAKNDINNQVVVTHVRNLDQGGHRTLGIITKPDTLHVGSEAERDFFDLAENTLIPWEKGFHVIRNRDFNNRAASTDDRDRIETEFFRKGIWNMLSQDDKGIGSLKLKLSDILREQIISELPSLIADVEKAAKDARDRLQRLGRSRETPHEQRIHLLRVSQAFVSLAKGAVDSQHDDAFFEDSKERDAYEQTSASGRSESPGRLCSGVKGERTNIQTHR